CHSLICPVVEETPCPADSIRPPSTWTDDHCCQVQQECMCNPKDSCEPVTCPDGFQVQVISLASWMPGSCCDKFRCVNESGLTCSYNGKELKNGETWDIDKCKTCECRDGLNRCRDKTCITPSCGWMAVPDDGCCPVCKGCVSISGQLYNESDVWREDDCTTCTCKNGHAQCQAEACAAECANPVTVPGQCCPVCPEETDAMSRQCPSIENCDRFCPLGHVYGEDGCPQCKCKGPKCDLDCPHGFQSDKEGQQLCKCRNKKCEYGFQRTADGCIKCKCNRCPQTTCTKTCIHGYVSNDEGCQLCKCKDAPSPSLTYPPMSAYDEEGKSCMSQSGARHDDGESWNDGCRICYCHNGIEMCSLIACPAPHCSNPVFRIGDCCPTCPGLTVVSTKGDQELCQSYQGRYYVEGETWNLDDCTQCVCHGGAILCQTPTCPPVICHHPIRPEGSCCAKCRDENLSLSATSTFPGHCKSSTGMFYKGGEIWQPTPCQSCTCQNGQIQCYNQMCPPVNCNRTILKKGQCCPVCVESRQLSVCMYNGATYEEGEQWQGDNCTQCICVNGKFQCFPLTCPSLHCSVMVVRKGHCCPECYDVAMLQDYKDRKDGKESYSNHTDLPASQYPHTNAKSNNVDANVVGFSILGVLVLILAIVVVLLVFIILRRRRHQARSPKFHPRPKSSHLEHEGNPFITPNGDGCGGGGVDSSDQQLHSKSMDLEKQQLEKLYPWLNPDRESRASNHYAEMIFGDQGKDQSKGNGHFLASVKT
ncbi:LOW QUALITY PROTEIN: cysteine-rich motor neuron 1 protein, partial [Plakobranchus ocellatus]